MNRRRALRVTGFGAAVVAVTAAVIVVVIAVTFIRRPLPERGGEIKLAGLKGRVTVLRDDRGVPQIYADDPVDLFRVQGYVNAEDRFFEMDLRRHITAGRLSELVGKNADALRADALVRTLGWRRVAEKELTMASASTRRYLDAYAEGVNDYVHGKSGSELSVSYAALGRSNPLPAIEPWTAVDSLAWLKAMAWDLRSNYDEELQRAQAVGQVRSINRVDQLYPPYPYAAHAPIIPGAAGAATNSSRIPAALSVTAPATSSRTTGARSAGKVTGAGGLGRVLASDAAQQAFAAAGTAIDSVPDLVGAGEGVGSNSWVVSGDWTATGLPLLANDPHLKVSMPGVWTQVGLHCNTVSQTCPFDVSGFGFAGMPGVVIGHNARIAWGLTNEQPDVTDFYLERITGDQAELDGRLRPLATRQETIQVAGDKPVTITVRATAHGPVISDVLDEVGRIGQSAPVEGEQIGERDATYAVSLAWTALTPGRAMDALLQLDVATNFDQFRSAVLKLDAPAQNVIYADVDGHIGYQSPGRIPVRGPGRASSTIPGDGTWPHPGWDSAYDWTGTVPVRKLPWVEDPREGFIVAANQAVAGPKGSVYLTSDWDYGYRSQRIREALQGAQRTQRLLTVADMRVLQNDTRNGIAPVLVPLLLKIARDDRLAARDPFTEQAVDLLKDWDYTQPADSAAAAYFNTVWETILNLTFADGLPAGTRPDGGDRWFAVVQSLLGRTRDSWWDDLGTPGLVEGRDEIMRRALVSARLQLTSTLGKDPDRWEWGRLHRLRLEQTPLGTPGSNALLRKLVNRGPYNAPGGSSIVDAFAWDASTGSFDVVSAPSMRMIVDMSNLDNSRWVNQTGVSGHPGDDHYDDQIDAWLAGQDFAWPASLRAVQAAKDEEQTFVAEAG